MSELSTAPMHRLLKKAGAARVSEDAAEELRIVLEEIGLKISEQAVILAQHAGRRTVKREDVQRAYKIIIKSSL
ncbi:MAG: histone family protein [Nitrososphaerota archaeon]